MGRTNSARIEAKWFIFSQRWRRPVEPDVAARNRNDLARLLRAPKHDSLDEIDCDSRSLQPSLCGGRELQRPKSTSAKWFPHGSGYSHSLVWPFQADQFKTISQRLPRIRLS